MAEPFVKLTIDTKTKKFIKNLEDLTEKEFIYNIIEKFFEKRALFVAGFISKNFLSGQRLKRRTGALARSITGRGIRIGGLPAMRVGIFKGPALAYAQAQEKGATIKPVKAKALAIPQKLVLTAAGVDKYGGPRNYPGELRFVPFRGSGIAVGGLYPAEELSKGVTLREAKIAYLLVTQVKIKPKNFLRDGLRETLPETASLLAELLRDLIAGRKRSS